ncbi:MAG: SH3 domain-containing protein [Candidatus Omnitrophica bacterium]|nr:SH3 domain-containing protein [Candidatus Omnitrophota bacterium]
MSVRLRALLLTACVFTLPFACLAEEKPETPVLGLVTADRVNLRSGPGASYEVVHQFSRRSKVQILAQQGDWYAVPLPDSVPAFVSRNFLQTESSGWVRVQADRVHVRAGPGLGSASYGTLSKDDRVRFWRLQGEWMAVQAPGFCRGWIHRSYVTLLESEPDTLKGDSS